MTANRVVSLTVHRNTLARRRAKRLRAAAVEATRGVVEAHGEAEAFFVVAMSRNGTYCCDSSIPAGTSRALWLAMLSEAAQQSVE